MPNPSPRSENSAYQIEEGTELKTFKVHALPQRMGLQRLYCFVVIVLNYTESTVSVDTLRSVIIPVLKTRQNLTPPAGWA